MHLLNLLPIGLCLTHLTTAAALPATTATGECKGPVKRLEWRQMTNAQKKSYTNAVLCLAKKKAVSGLSGTTSRFEDHVAVHSELSPQIHWVGQFVLWHRYFLATYEKALRNECGYTGGQPYWDYSQDADPANPESMAPFEGEIFNAETGFGGNGDFVEPNPGNNPYGIEGSTGGGCVKDGPFAPPNFMLNYPEYSCLKRDFIPRFINTNTDPKLVTELLETKDYTSFAWTVEKTKDFAIPSIHSGGHFGIGGAQGQGGRVEISPTEPLFYLHHGNIDHIFWMWQQDDLEARLNDVGGPIEPFDYGGKNITLDFETNVGPLAGNVKLRDLLDTEGGLLCYTY